MASLFGNDSTQPQIFNQRGRDITPVPIEGGRRYLIPVKGGSFAKVDAGDLDKVRHLSWSPQKGSRGHFYAAAACGKTEDGKLKRYLMHRVIMGVTDPKIEVDHANRNETLNNTRENLRVADHGQQQYNAERPLPVTGYRGVCPAHDTPGSFTAYVDYKKVRHQVPGTFRSAEDAARARDRLALKLQGEFATLNFSRSDYVDVE